VLQPGRRTPENPGSGMKRDGSIRSLARTPGRSATKIVVAIFVLALPAGGFANGTPVAARPQGKPNFLVIVSDDQRADALSTMPVVQDELIGHGVDFTNGFVSNAICCPSRTSILTGQYSHSTGVWGNQPPDGGFAFFNDRSTLPVWMQAAGYRTALFGKYMNSYEQVALNSRYVPPGWDEWFAFAESQYFNYHVNDNGTLRWYGDRSSDYSTDVLATAASSYIRDTSGPLMVFFDPAAPHAPATPAPRDASAFSHLPKWDPPSYNEGNMSDKPAWMQDVKPLGDRAQKNVQDFRRGQYGTLLALDDAVHQLLSALQATGRLDNTFIIYTSDNAIEWGEHRWTTKRVPYEESIHVPFIVRYDPLTSNARTDPHLVVNIDIAPTVADVAGIKAPGAEGRSIVPLLNGRDPPWRDEFLLEHMQSENAAPPSFCGIRTEHETYVFYATGEEELYNLRTDPYELNNLAARPGMESTLRDFRARLAKLCKPPPPGLDLSTPPIPPGEVPQGHGDGGGHRGGRHGAGNRGSSGGRHGNGQGAHGGSGSAATQSGGPAPTSPVPETPVAPTWTPPPVRSGSGNGQSRGGSGPTQGAGPAEPGVQPNLASLHAQETWLSRAAQSAGLVIVVLAALAFLVLLALAFAPGELLRRFGAPRHR
jgi:N-acetylglucosamine-6-sulfatase